MRRQFLLLLAAGLALFFTQTPNAQERARQPDTIRIAYYNTALSRRGAGVMWRDLVRAKDRQIDGVLAVIAATDPDILVLGEVDFDPEGHGLEALRTRLRTVGQDFAYGWAGPVNTGEPSGLDLNGDGKREGPADAYGFGFFPGQFGMAVLSRYPIDLSALRSFRLLRWADLPDAALPLRADGTSFPSAQAQAAMRLSSKSHWDLPVETPFGALHLMVSHPTPPVFDDAHDLNGRRNADEIRFWSLYLSGIAFADDQGRNAPRRTAPFVLAGDLNSDPLDGDSRHAAIRSLLAHPALQDPAPRSPGAVAAAGDGINRDHLGDPALDTADFRDDIVGNLRVDYLLPDARLTVIASGVFWPAPGEAGHALVADPKASSDHRLVWVDIRMP
ncbi:MAG: endonuclease/exonuclease/phosphatase family protein [Pseudomonadota bacterium]